MSGFTKLVPEIVQSSIWNESSDVRVVWITMLAVKDASGYVRGDARTLSRLANVSLEATEKALALFMSPDPSSHTTDDDGRRIGQAAGGWVVLNHDKYRARDHQAEHRAYVKQWREKKAKCENVIKCESHVNHSESHVIHPSASASASASAKEGMQGENGAGRKTSAPPTENEAQAYAMEIGFEEWVGWFDHFQANGWLVGGKSKMKDWKAAMRNGKRMSAKFAKGRAGNNGKRTNAEKAEDWKRQAAEQAKARPPIATMPPEFNRDEGATDYGLSMLGCEEVAQ